MSNKKFNIKLFNKITLTILGSAAIIVPIAYFSTARGSAPLLSAAGSSAVFPLMKAFSQEYNGADISVQAGGSGVGIQSILNNNKTFGMVSKNPFSDFEKNKAKWTERKIKTVTVAWDGMGLVYKDTNPTTPAINLTSITIQEIYKAFDGNSEVRYSDLGLIDNNTIVTPFARTGGADASGTADSFLKSSNLLSKEESDAIKKKYPSLQNGNYGKFTKQTPESNSQALQQVLTSNEPGAMVYLSAGFIIKNKVDLEKKGFKIATYNGIEIDAGQITSGYNWFRPLNVLFSLDKVQEEVKGFVKWMVDTNSISQKILEKENFISLNEEQKLSMYVGDNLFVSDSELGYTGAKANSLPLTQFSRNLNNKIIFDKNNFME